MKITMKKLFLQIVCLFLMFVFLYLQDEEMRKENGNKNIRKLYVGLAYFFMVMSIVGVPLFV